MTLACCFTAVPAPAQKSVPAELVDPIRLPGTLDEIARPSAIHYDAGFDELYLGDAGRNRIVVFNGDGVYRFSFTGGDRFSVPFDVDVDSQGYVYVVGSSREGRHVHRYDYDGRYLATLPLPASFDDAPFEPGSVAIDREDRLYVADRETPRIVVLNGHGELIDRFPVVEDLESETREEQFLGAITVVQETIYVPAPPLGSVYRYDLQGRPLGRIGHKGNDVGELNFPVAVARTPDGILLILDKNRFATVCFDERGSFLGEFGGKGFRPGWFYYPSLLAAGSGDRVYIAQVHESLIQICRIPGFIIQGNDVGCIGSESPQGSRSDRGAALQALSTQREEGSQQGERLQGPHLQKLHDHHFRSQICNVTWRNL
ncbi:MAG: hypothetical protein GF346_01225 [Candidatus Eisenbacteria bacterium]|nr:hypothetical protein [Candidatus Latescibacterota bacterium]MBD3301051.1 hypothetical protein [Candidatus Eisenbacteria bacterium]